jgi:geranylgeranyl pyrophosphate synthase
MFLAQAFCYDHLSYVYNIFALCKVIHNATLIIDNIEDNSKVRKSKECVHLLYGVNISVNARNLIYLTQMMRLFKSDKHRNKQLSHMVMIYLYEMTSQHIRQG